MSVEIASATSAAPMAASPPTSKPSSPQRRRFKHQNSFSIFESATANGIVQQELRRSPSDESTESTDSNEESESHDPLWRKLLITPLLSISFILSLFIVERRDRTRRSAEHSHQSNNSFWSVFTLQNWLDPEPYQDPADATWQGADAGAGAAAAGEKKRWFMRKKHRKMSKIAVTDALDMSGSMMLVLLVVACVIFASIGWLATKMWYAIK